VPRELSAGARQRLKDVYTGPRAAVPNKAISLSAAGIPRERERDSRKLIVLSGRKAIRVVPRNLFESKAPSLDKE